MRLIRSILSACGALLIGVPVFTSAAYAGERDDSASEKLGIKLSLQCYTYRALTFFETVDKAKELGVKYLEIYPGQRLKPGSNEKIGHPMSEAQFEEIQKKLTDAGGIKIVAYGVADVPGDETGARKNFEWAKKMGIGVLVTESMPTEVHDKLCGEFQIRMALHNHPLTWPPDDVLKACEGRSKLIGSCSDTGHWMRRRLNPVDQFKKLEGRVLHSHLKDLNEFHHKAHDLPWGTGKGDVKGMLAELARQGFKGCMSIEYESGSVQELDQNLPKCIAFFDATLKELAGGGK